MTLDCTNPKPGDKVRLRNGDIDIVQRNDHDDIPIKLKGRMGYHFSNGRWFKGKVNDLDIVEILAKAETTHGVSQPMSTFPFSWRYRLGTLELSDFTFRDPVKITINGKQYIPARDPDPCYPLPYKHTYTVSATTGEVVAITRDGKRFTPADSWPEPITDRPPTEEDADERGYIQVLDDGGDWMRREWDCVKDYLNLGWAKTSDWKPRPIDKKTLTLRDLREAMRAGESPDHDTLQSAIELLEATL